MTLLDVVSLWSNLGAMYLLYRYEKEILCSRYLLHIAISGPLAWTVVAVFFLFNAIDRVNQPRTTSS